MSENEKKYGVLASIVKGNVEYRGKVFVEGETLVAVYVENNESKNDVFELSQLALVGRHASGEFCQIDLTFKNGSTFVIKSLPGHQVVAEWNQLGEFLLTCHSK